ncbi:MAG TPA: TraR/DksA C4-type zinc finger protein [Candidatus Dormibacteraeota bacterium]|jgi:phage/conjugal plasmid C-4 type zinc finger TraR family protein
MSRGFRDADATQAMSDQAVAEAIGKILERDGASGRGDGLCVECGKAISAERLEVLPDAARCVGCQAAWEQANRI